MGCCRIPNRQSVRTLKKASCPVATIVTILSLITSLGAIARYTKFFLKEACDEGWMPIKDVCILNTHFETTHYDAHRICKNLDGKPPAVPNPTLLKGIMVMTGERQFWMTHHEDYTSVYEHTGGGTIPKNTKYDKDKHTCLLSEDGILHHNCMMNVTVVCMKEMHG
ncbi:EEV glycoprotein [Pseudocowpox virus]|uniref:EEV glycoprotein n=1 Tax=Pseudocowpox virus TaxID=129726 RepID=D3IZQ9_9POXV|nr:EEV glycoprotein [Pseudocowpox virus]ADC54013.1 EEV glycoprotein [Pseudocowpox virus]